MLFGIRHIRYFKAVAEELHYGRAAKQLNIAQPALSRSIKHLETRLGVQLLERNNRKVSLTKAGKVFLTGCQQLIDTMEGMVIQTRKASAGEAGHLIIGYTDFAISGLMPAILRDFRKQYPDISIEPVHGFTGTQLDQLEQGKLDVGFITGPFESPDYQSVVIQRDSYVVVVYDNHPLAQRESVQLKELTGESFILGTPTGWEHYHDHLFRLCRAAGFKPDIVQTAFNVEGIFGLVACEMGITIQPVCVKENLRKGLVARPIRGIKATVPTMAVWKSETGASTRQTFAQFLIERQKIAINNRPSG
ncbi:MAG: LysR family transcriptional regulator [Thiolinea sp.]